jgi:hypothetical protein
MFPIKAEAHDAVQQKSSFSEGLLLHAIKYQKTQPHPAKTSIFIQ